MQIRLAGIHDIDALVELRSALWPEGSREEHRSEIRGIVTGQPPSTLPLAIFVAAVAEHEGALVGFAEVGLRSHADGCDPAQPCGFLEGWYVRPDFSRQGIGRALVEHAEAWARQQGCIELASDTWLDNEPSQRAHEALGFEVAGRCVNYRKSLAHSQPPAHATSHYGADLARIHHQHFGRVANAAAAELIRRLHARGLRSGTVVDLAAGSGILSRRALDAGFHAVGVDISADMLDIARSHAADAHLVRGSLWRFDLPACVAVAAVGEAFNYATEADAPSLARLEERFDAIAHALAPGGLLLFDVAGPGRSGHAGSRQVIWEEQGTLLYLDEREDASRVTRRIQTFVPAGSLYRRSQEHHSLVLYHPDEVAAALARTGYSVERLDAYDGPSGFRGFQLAPGWSGFAATKRPPR